LLFRWMLLPSCGAILPKTWERKKQLIYNFTLAEACQFCAI
jgi:hypothetical protein